MRFVAEHRPKAEVALFGLTVPLAAKKDLNYTVADERPVKSSGRLANNCGDQMRLLRSVKDGPGWHEIGTVGEPPSVEGRDDRQEVTAAHRPKRRAPDKRNDGGVATRPAATPRRLEHLHSWNP